ncbi:MAG: asparagine synthase (glutamine-hydrolyzing) [Candidatus Aenigmatarchaeota archaeon]
MCGFCGFVNFFSKDRSYIFKMTRLLLHRGPDAEGIKFWEKEGVALGHRRLSIIDLSINANQPLSNEDNTVWLVFNGEIYNFKSLREDLEKRGHKFKSYTDSEVIIHLYEEKGIDCINDFIGMFSFAIWDFNLRRLFLVRDRLGIKPLYYSFVNKSIFFASELKSLLVVPEIIKEVSFKNLLNYLIFLWAPYDITPFKFIYKLPPAHYLLYENGNYKTYCWWDVDLNREKLSLKKCEEKIEELLFDAVKLRLISDVPLGTFLSGGLDSSLILFLVSKFLKEKIITYTIGFKSQDLKYEICPDDIYYSRQMRDFIKSCDYNEIFVEPDVAELWSKIVWHLEEPIGDPAGLSTYLICKQARNKAKVMLSGMGGEEVFAGYNRYLATKLSFLIPKFLKNISLNFINELPASSPSPFMRYFRNLKKFTKSLKLEFPQNYLGYFSYYSLEEIERLTGSKKEYLEIINFFIEKYFNKVKNQNFLDQILYVDQKTFLASLNLTYTDKASMACGLEVRVPLLDHRIVEFSFSIPHYFKIKNMQGKYILKRIASKYLPQAIVWRKKAGFSAPIRAWVKNKKVKELIYDYLSYSTIKKRGFFNFKEVDKILKEDAKGKEDNAFKIWELLTLEIWFRTFVDDTFGIEGGGSNETNIL